MFFRRRTPKQHLFGPRTLAILSALCAMYVIRAGTTGSAIQISVNCEHGLLSAVSDCRRDSSTDGTWSYSYATGPIDMALCDKMSLNSEELTVPNAQKLIKTDCKHLQLDNTHFCYASQQLENSKRIANVFVTNSRCGDARFFRGANVMLIENTPTIITDWQKSYTGISELKN